MWRFSCEFPEERTNPSLFFCFNTSVDIFFSYEIDYLPHWHDLFHPHSWTLIISGKEGRKKSLRKPARVGDPHGSLALCSLLYQDPSFVVSGPLVDWVTEWTAALNVCLSVLLTFSSPTVSLSLSLLIILDCSLVQSHSLLLVFLVGSISQKLLIRSTTFISISLSFERFLVKILLYKVKSISRGVCRKIFRCAKIGNKWFNYYIFIQLKIWASFFF